jgi:GxxExxY protein
LIKHKDPEGRRVTETTNALSELVIGAAIEVHRTLGPGLLESAYESCLARELQLRELMVERQVYLDLEYKGVLEPKAYRIDLIVDHTLLVEVKAVEELSEIHKLQLLTYLRLSGKPLGLLINFNVPVLWKGVRRVICT